MPTRFALGRLVITRTAHDALVYEDAVRALRRHARGDWGDLCEEDRAENDQSLDNGYRLLSAYADRRGTRFWIITEADRSATTVLLPEDY